MISLQSAARAHYGRRCPCCGVHMHRNRGKWRNGRLPVNAETRGHDVAVARFGDPNVWVPICWRCNNEQGDLSFAVWAKRLQWLGDPREIPVLELAVFIRRYLNGIREPRPHVEVPRRPSRPDPDGGGVVLD